MPTYRRTLSNREQRRHEDQLRWFARAGLEIETSPTEAVPPAVDVSIGYTANFLNVIYEHTIWLVVIIGVRLVAREPRIRLIDELFVASPWEEDLAFDFLPMEKTGDYHIGRQYFEKALVVNHDLLDGPLPVGKPLEGLLIAQACGAKLPTTYRPGDPVHVIASFADTLDRVYSAEGKLTVNPSFHTDSRLPPRSHSSLFDDDMPASPRMQQGTRSFSKTTRLKSKSNKAVSEGACSMHE
jgi:hypothetical protein